MGTPSLCYGDSSSNIPISVNNDNQFLIHNNGVFINAAYGNPEYYAFEPLVLGGWCSNE